MNRRLRALAASIRGCRLCPGLGAGFPGRGPDHPRVLFVGEAPGRFGCGRTRVPFLGDRSGENFSILLRAAGLRRDEVFVTNAVHCLPLQAGGRNRRPYPAEWRNCRRHLLAEIAILRPPVVATLGGIALRALTGGRIARLSEEVARPRESAGVALFPLYHPSPRVVGTVRSLEEQARDYEALGRWMRRRGRANGSARGARAPLR